jgi:phage shock protein PspC (stress-responsive transcriptional regulator)
MNEVTHIHLGRQPFTISVDAHQKLKTYLAAIKKEVADEEVAKEVESRMSELLIERGVAGEKVVLPEDIEYLKEQLGDPGEFGGGDESTEEPKASEEGSKKLYRDTDNALVAGVSAGIANYFGLDVVLVRLVFVLLAIFGGGIGIILYILFWLVVPPAITTSEKLQMRGRPVTLEALKDSVSKADVPGTARRINSSLLSFIDGAFRVAIKIIGISLVIAGLGLISGVAITKAYMLLHNGQLFQENLFPIGLREEWLLATIMVLVVILSVFLILAGIATFKRKWPVRGWITGVLAGLFLVGSVAGAALAADIAPRVQERYEATLHTTAVKNIQPFNKVVTSGEVDITYITSPTYAVNLHYSDHPDLSKVKVKVENGTLYIDSQDLDRVQHCTMLCLFPRYNMTVQVYAPNVHDFNTPKNTEIFYPAPPPLN